MSFYVKRNLACLLGITLACAWADAGRAALILNDHFDYGNSDALRLNWKPVTAGSLSDFNNTFAFAPTDSGLISALAAQRPSTLTNQTLIGFNGRSAYFDLPQVVDKDFVLTAYVGQNSYSRTIQVGVGDNSGAGYSWGWTGGNPTANGGNGLLNIRAQASWTNAPGAATGSIISANVQGGSPPTRYALPNPVLAGAEIPQRINYSPSDVFLGYSELKLTWTAETGLLELYQDGVLKASATNTLYNSFSRVYMGGGNRSHVDLVTLFVVPEPTAAALCILGAVLFASCGRSKWANALN